MSLNDIFDSHNTDKGAKAPPELNGSGGNNYGPCYERYLRPESIKLLVEIGIWRGGSLHAWKDWIPHATIVGVDINPQAFCKEREGIVALHGDGTNIEDASKIVQALGNPDVVIDDGSHLWDDQIRTWDTWWPYLKKGGWYVCEDLHTSFNGQWQKGNLRAVDFFAALTTNVHKTSDIKGQDSDFDVEEMHFHDKIIFMRKRH